MEFVGIRRGRKRKRKNRRITNNKRRDKIKFEVISEKKVKQKRFIFVKKEKVMDYTKGANAFWENYKAAHEWQKKHNIMWWQTRCSALEHENYVLKETIRNLAQTQNCNKSLLRTTQNNEFNMTNVEYSNEDDDNTDDNLEFHLNDDMMDFLAQSIRHKIELKNKKDSEKAAEVSEENKKELVENQLTLIKKKSEDAKLLYGEASSRVLAMETALQTTVNRHIDKAKPQYWPHLPLKL